VIAAAGGAPEAATITESVEPTEGVAGQPVRVTFELSGFNEAVPDLAIDYGGDFQDHYTINSVTLALNGGAKTACSVDPSASNDYVCGNVAMTDTADLVITATPKDGGDFNLDVLFASGEFSSNTYQTFGGDNSATIVAQSVTA
jgi:hypothetical protein